MEKFNHEQAVAKLKANVIKEFNNAFPFERGDYRFEVKDIEIKEPSVTYEDQQKAFLNDESIEAVVRGTIEVYYKDKLVKSQKSILTRVPYPTDRGSYVTAGNEIVVLNRMQRRNGIFVRPVRNVNRTQMLTADVRAGYQRFKIDFDTNRGQMKISDLSMDYGKTSPGQIDVIPFLKFLGVDDAQIKQAINDDTLYNSLMKNASTSSPRKIYGTFFAKEFPGDEEARQQIISFMNNNLTFSEDSQKLNKQTIGESSSAFDATALLGTISQLVKEFKKPGVSPDPDDFRFKEIKSPEDTVGEYVRKGIREWINNRLRRITYTDMNEQKRQTMNAKPDQYIYKGTKQLYQSDIAELVDTSNPLDLHQKLYKVTSLGTGGLSTRAASNYNRNLQDTAFAKIDAVETPQSQRMGLVQHFASGAKVKNGRLYSKFYRVTNGKIDTSKIIDDIDPLDEFDEYIAFNTPPTLSKDDNGRMIGFKNDTVRVRHKGSFENVPRNKVTLIDSSSSAHMSHSTALIPFGSHNDGARMLMGAGMQKQSLSLENPEAPLVQSVSDPVTGKTVEEEMADRASNILRSPVSGTVKKITDNYIEIDTGSGTERVKKLNYFTTGKSGGYIHHKPVVQVGDKVNKDQLLADGWQSKDGKLALGRNIRVAYMPWKGYNFEDGVVVSESFAKKMASEEVKTIEFELESQEGKVKFGTPEAKKLLKDLHVSPGILGKLDENGVIKKGTDVAAGDYLVAAVKVKEKEDLSAGQKDIRRMMRNKIIELPSDLYKDVSRKVVGYQKGKVISVNVTPTSDGNLKAQIKLLSFKPMEVGDKLSGRHGNKGTITKIVPDKEMPHQTDGKPIELIFSPLAVPSRKNIGQLLEVNAGLVAEKTGKSSYNVLNFDSSQREKLEQELKDIGMPDGKQTLINPETGKPYENPVTVGPMYILKLKHKVEGKITQRNMRGAISEELQSPRKTSGNIDGDRHNPQGVGGMEFWSLTSAGAVHNIHEMTTLKSDGAGDKKKRAEIFNAIRKGVPVPDPVTPQSLKVLQDKLYAAGVSMTPLRDDKEVTLDDKFTDLMLNPMKRDELKKLGAAPVTTAKGLKARTNTFADGGIYDPAIFGENGDHWGRIDLIEPVPNPLFLESDQGSRPYEAMLLSKGLRQKDIKEIVNGKKFVVFDPKDSGLEENQLVDMGELDKLQLAGKEVEADTGGSALTRLVEGVDLKTELKNAEQRLKEARTVPERSLAQKHVMALSRALDKGLEPTDFLMESVPVLPLKYRKPLSMNGGKTFAEDGISQLYQGLLKQNEEYKKKAENSDPLTWDRAVYSGVKSDYYNSIKNIIGVGPAFKDDKRDQDIKGIMHTLKSKRGFVRSKMQTKLQDYSGRSVIAVDPTLKLDEVALPEDMAAEMFQPLILGELQKQRYSTKEIKKFMTHHTPEYRRALEKVSSNRPVILNRQPSLHRHSLQAFYPKILWNEDGVKKRAIGLNPVVTTAFNADFDGDTMAVHLPITTDAIKEAEEKLLPSKNLLNPTNNSLITDLKHEMQLGIYYMTRDRMPEGTPKEFKSLKDLEAAYHKGEVKTYDAVRMNVPGLGQVTSTAGRHIFNLSLPRGFQNYKDNVDVNKKKMEHILMNIINAQSGGGTMKAVETINKLQNVGFHSATTSGISIGFRDFDEVRKIDKDGLFAAADKQLKEKYKDKLASGMIDAQDAMEQEKSQIVQSQMKKLIESSLDPNNPVEIMRSSGARGNAGQINAMSGILGVGKSVTGEMTRPINASHLDGLTPDQFWDLSYDSRKGILDKSIESEKPGALTRELWMTNKGTVISEKDCGDTIGVNLDMNVDADKRAIHGRVLLKDVPLDKGGSIKATGRPLTVQQEEMIRTRAKGKVNVRSPLTCKSSSGICQKCYGIKPGGTTNDFVEIGSPIGSIAAQALGEPSQQAIMKAFHVGGAQSSASGAFDRIQEILRLPKNLTNSEVEAVIAQQDGVITSITKDPLTGTIVTVDKKKYKLNKKPLADYVKEGVSIKRGDLLTKEFDANGDRVTIRNPHDVLMYQGPDVAKQYLTDSLEEAYRKGDITNTDRRHYEVATSNLMGKAVVTDPGTSPFASGQVVPVKVLNKYNQQAGRVVSVPMDYANRMNVIGAIAAQDYSDIRNPMKIIVKKGSVITETTWEQLKNRPHIKVQKKPLQFNQTLSGVSTVDLASHNWLETSSYRDATRTIGEATILGMKDKLDNPLTRQMTGQKGNFAEGFTPWNEKQKDNFVNGFL
ncbi:hypothetical protein [Priestia megaterium]|uniref:hypothetical protein n=1 Tax=Priestia megaterium TaxID=1404 RepID=UPI000BFC40EC|nr:hypothetical protein [Priestia megaterium]PGQ88193.1 hypothetical protein COA18_04515 [Priestia megaterium]